MRSSLGIHWGTHLPVLIQLMDKTAGDVLELGTGVFSTPYLHYACMLQGRKLVSYENDPEYYEANLGYQNIKGDHTVSFVDDWSKIPIEKKWDIAFIDVLPEIERKELARRLKDCATYVVLHDAQNKWEETYQYSEIYPLFKYKFFYKPFWPKTAILSNFKEIRL